MSSSLRDPYRGPRLPKEASVVESTRIERALLDCGTSVLPLDDDPVERARIERAFRDCQPRVLPLDELPERRAGKESNPASSLWRRRCALRSDPAPRKEIESLSLHGQWSCDTNRITRQIVSLPGKSRTCLVRCRKSPLAFRRDGEIGVLDGDRTRLRRVTVCPRHQTSTSTIAFALTMKW